MKSLLLVLLLLAPVAAVTQAAAQKIKACHEKGFTELLQCSSCSKLESFVADEDLRSDCLACCRSDSVNNEVYVSAVLEVCPRKVGLYPEVLDFIEGKAAAFSNVEVKYVRGAPPTIRLRNKAGAVGEEVNVAAWRANTMVDFLTTKLSVKA